MEINPYRLAFPRRGWAELRWSAEHQPRPVMRERLHELALISGIRYEDGWSIVELPETTWTIGSVSAFIRSLDLQPPTHLRHLPPEELGLKPARRELRSWQRDGALYALQYGRGLLLADVMGLGKTATAISACENYAAGSDAPRIVVGPRFVRDVWKNELLATGAIEDEAQFCGLGTRDFNDKSFNPDALWYFVHYEVVNAWSTRIASWKRGKPITAVIDEAHWIKNPNAQRSKGAFTAVGGARFRLLLTGTPLDNAVEELWYPLTVLTGSRTWGMYATFRRRYAGALGTAYGLRNGIPTHQDELRERISPYYLRRTLDDIGAELPPLQRQKLTVELDVSAAAKHHAIVSQHDVRELVDAIIDGRSGRDAFEVIDKLRKITSIAKRKSTIEFVKNLLEQEESVVVFTWQKKMAEEIASASPTPFIIHGDIPNNIREQRVREFQSSGGLLVATSDALKEGVTLHRARIVIQHDLDWKTSSWLQKEARIHRLGQTKGCVSILVVAEDSIDTILARCLLQKAELIEQTLEINTASRAADELDLSRTAGYQDIKCWARDVLDRWRR
jgi:SNF2 family DNA or RNA helicase